MATALMTRCAVKRLYKIEGKKETRWVEIEVSDLSEYDEVDVRCALCHGAVRVQRQKLPKNPHDHVVHRSRADSQNCQGGNHFQGTHQLSARPVE